MKPNVVTKERFLIKLWETKTVRKEGAVQSFMDWKFERCNYEQLVDLLMKHLGSMAEHNFMASWNYVQYKEARKNITVGDVIFVHDFAQNYPCQHQHEVQGLHWRHQQVTLMPARSFCLQFGGVGCSFVCISFVCI